MGNYETLFKTSKSNYSCEKKHILLVAIEFNKNKMIKIN